jgi:hypothetical protein
MPYSDVDTNLDNLTSEYNLPEGVRTTLFDYDESGEKNVWKQFETNKTLLSNQLQQANTEASNLGEGFSGMGARSAVKDTTSDMFNEDYGGMLDKSLYQEYKLKTDWREEQLGTISDAITSGDASVKHTDDNGFTPPGWTGGTPGDGTTFTDNYGDDWIYENGSWRNDYGSGG